MEGFERAAPEPQVPDSVPLAVQDLQPGEERGVQLGQTVVPHVQLGHVTQEIRLVRNYAGDLVQPEERGLLLKSSQKVSTHKSTGRPAETNSS